MTEIFYWTGLFTLTISAIFGGSFTLLWVWRNVVGLLASRAESVWCFIEYIYYRSDFKEWVKDKDRHPKCDPTFKNESDGTSKFQH